MKKLGIPFLVLKVESGFSLIMSISSSSNQLQKLSARLLFNKLFSLLFRSFLAEAQFHVDAS